MAGVTDSGWELGRKMQHKNSGYGRMAMKSQQVREEKNRTLLEFRKIALSMLCSKQ